MTWFYPVVHIKAFKAMCLSMEHAVGSTDCRSVNLHVGFDMRFVANGADDMRYAIDRKGEFDVRSR
jgi:hypothetical protein